MKKKLLILTNNPVAKVGIASYLSSIFNQYLTIAAARVADITPDTLKEAECILYSTENVRNKLPFTAPEHVCQLVCMRTFNHTYLHRILQIPPGTTVYLVNDTEHNAREIIEQLQECGFSQYHFLPYYPGCSQVCEDIRYCVTPGESHLVPSFIRQTIDIGNRVVDISTINEIIACFGLPTSLADEVTRSYMNHIVQILKLSNQQLSRSLDMKEIAQMILENVSEGLCLIDQSGKIELVNRGFMALTGFLEQDVAGCDFSRLLRDYELNYDFPRQSEGVITKEGQAPFRLWFQKFSSSQNQQIYLMHASLCETEGSETFYPARTVRLSDFQHFITDNPLQRHMLDTARRVSLNDLPIIIQGESGTEKELLAQAIHRNSLRHDGAFISLNFSSLKLETMETELLNMLGAASGGTLLINGLLYTDLKAQQLLLNILKNGYYMAPDTVSPRPLNVRIIATTTADLYAQVLAGRFLDDLFFLLNAVSLNTIPLRQRRGDIPLLLNSLLRSAFREPEISASDIMTERLLTFFSQYDWPGNVQEMRNVCSYFSCVYRRETLSLSDLPGYILNQLRSRQTGFDMMEKKILSLIVAHPRSGRSFLQDKLKEEGITLSEGKIRTILAHLAESGYIKVHRTRGGCEATELGLLMYPA